ASGRTFRRIACRWWMGRCGFRLKGISRRSRAAGFSFPSPACGRGCPSEARAGEGNSLNESALSRSTLRVSPPPPPSGRGEARAWPWLNLHHRQFAKIRYVFQIVQLLEQRLGLLSAEPRVGAVQKLLAQLCFAERLLPVALRARDRLVRDLPTVLEPDAQ